MPRMRAKGPHGLKPKQFRHGASRTHVPMQSSAFNPPLEVDLGEKLREIRQARNLTLRALAELSGLNVNTLSLIEKGRTSPTVSTLQQLAGALQVPLMAFFEIPIPKQSIVFQKNGHRPTGTFAYGTLEDLGAGLSLGKARPLLLTLAPGSDSGEIPIVHTGEEFIYCLEGCVTYWIDDQAFELLPGDSLIFEAHHPHRWGNRGMVPSRSLLIFCPTDEDEGVTERHFM